MFLYLFRQLIEVLAEMSVPLHTAYIWPYTNLNMCSFRWAYCFSYTNMLNMNFYDILPLSPTFAAKKPISSIFHKFTPLFSVYPRGAPGGPAPNLNNAESRIPKGHAYGQNFTRTFKDIKYILKVLLYENTIVGLSTWFNSWKFIEKIE